MNPKRISKVQILRTGADASISIRGSVDENFAWPDLDKTGLEILHIDLKDLTMINSLGCRDWSLWIQSLKADRGIYLHRCPPVFVRAMGILDGLVPRHIQVESFYVPYVCATCSHEDLLLCERMRHFENDKIPNIPQEIPCAKCKARMSIDVLEKTYFRFLAQSAA